MTDTATYQRKRRALLKAQGFRQKLLTFDPQTVSALKYIQSRMGGDLTHIIKASVLTQMHVLQLARTYHHPEEEQS